MKTVKPVSDDGSKLQTPGSRRSLRLLRIIGFGHGLEATAVFVNKFGSQETPGATIENSVDLRHPPHRSFSDDLD